MSRPLRLNLPALLLAATALWSLTAVAASPSCALADHCVQASTFTARVTDFRTTVQGSNRRIIATVAFQNLTDRPLIIGYVRGSGLGLDEHGNRYTPVTSNGVRGIGEIERNRFDSRFTLQPGERAEARFELGWYAGNQIAGGTENGAGAWRFAVLDEGPGIDPAHYDDLFRPYFTTKEKGNGIGLAQAQRVVREHGGDLRAEAAPGGGAAFVAEIPVSPSPAEASGGPAATH